jgi:ubiquinone biosynthesis protein UbiJ
VSVLNPFELLAKLPTPTEVLSGLMQVPQVLSDKNLLASHIAYRLSQTTALAVRQMAQQESWVGESAEPHFNRIVDVVLPMMGVNHTLRWQIVPKEILLAQRVEPELDAKTINASPANVTLTVMPTVYDELNGLPFDTALDVQAIMRHVHISGPSDLAQWVSRLVENLRPDVWAQLADIIGATPAGFVQQGFARAKSDIQSLTEKLKTRCLDGDEYHPAVVVRHAKLEELSKGVQAVRNGVDALAQRVAQLYSQKPKASP